ncbi:hypothetical protein PR729_18970 [Providencia rettgeri]|nr:hypothetical protein PR729_26005 [Providencia rettgeri]OBY35590.1 hypothetical protein PR729_18970 [Providencia rettgeri]
MQGHKGGLWRSVIDVQSYIPKKPVFSHQIDKMVLDIFALFILTHCIFFKLSMPMIDLIFPLILKYIYL